MDKWNTYTTHTVKREAEKYANKLKRSHPHRKQSTFKVRVIKDGKKYLVQWYGRWDK